MVLLLPSLRPRKLRLNDVMMAFSSSLPTSVRFHWPSPIKHILGASLASALFPAGYWLAPAWRRTWPMQGPQALASTSPPAFSSAASRPSRWMVARICSEPGVTSSCDCSFRPAAAACLAIDAALVMSS